MPEIIAATSTAPKFISVAFASIPDQPLQFSLGALDKPAVVPSIISVEIMGTVASVSLSDVLTPRARYCITLAGQPNISAAFTGFHNQLKEARQFQLWDMLPAYNRRIEETQDLRRFIACLQDTIELLLSQIDRFTDIIDIERAPEKFIDRMLADLGNPFTELVSPKDKRRLAAVLVDMYRQKGTAKGLRSALRMLLALNDVSVLPIIETTWDLGQSFLDDGTSLGPSSSAARYSFEIHVERQLTSDERRKMKTIVEYMKPAHTHFLGWVEPQPIVPVDGWLLGAGEIPQTAMLY